MQSKLINDDYRIFEDGSIVSYCHSIAGKLLKHHLNNNGYLTVEINGKERKVHQLVAEAFVAGYFEGAVVNHLDGNKSNCHYTNLEWCTNSANTKHAYDTGLCPKNKGQRADNRAVVQYSKDLVELARYNSITEAAKAVTNNISSGRSKILQVCTKYTYNGYTRKTAFGYVWKFENDL